MKRLSLFRVLPVTIVILWASPCFGGGDNRW